MVLFVNKFEHFRYLFAEMFFFYKAENVTLLKKEYFSFQKLKNKISNTFLKNKK